MAVSVVQYPETTAQVAITCGNCRGDVRGPAGSEATCLRCGRVFFFSTVSVSLVKPADAERPERVPDEAPDEAPAERVPDEAPDEAPAERVPDEAPGERVPDEAPAE